MKIAFGCDHAGFLLKQTVLDTLTRLGHEVIDFGTHNQERVDYPDFAAQVAAAVAEGKAERGILVCGSGVGVCITAGKFKGIYAAICHDAYTAHQAVEHDGLNVLCLGARVIGPAVAEEVIEQFLSAHFLAGTRHEARLHKVKMLENEHFK